MTPNRSSNGCGVGVQALSLHVGNPVSFQTGEVRLSWHGAIVSLCDIKRVSNPPTMLHLTSEFTISVRVERQSNGWECPLWFQIGLVRLSLESNLELIWGISVYTIRILIAGYSGVSLDG